MSEETTQQQTTEEIQQPEVQPLEPMNVLKASLTERLNHAYIAKEYTLLNGGSDNVIMIQASREGRYPIDILLTFDGLEEVMNQLRPETAENPEASDGNEE